MSKNDDSLWTKIGLCFCLGVKNDLIHQRTALNEYWGEPKHLHSVWKLPKKSHFNFTVKKREKSQKNRLQTDFWYVVKVRRLFWWFWNTVQQKISGQEFIFLYLRGTIDVLQLIIPQQYNKKWYAYQDKKKFNILRRGRHIFFVTISIFVLWIFLRRNYCSLEHLIMQPWEPESGNQNGLETDKFFFLLVGGSAEPEGIISKQASLLTPRAKRAYFQCYIFGHSCPLCFGFSQKSIFLWQYKLCLCIQ